jgi:serine/threonine protein kinase
MVARAEEAGTGASVVLAPTSIGTVAKAELLEGQWRLVKLLGQGAVGQVWQAHDVTLDRAVAVKLMHEGLAQDPSQVARFEREARVLAALEHPNLLPVLGIGRMGTRPFLVTRLLEGRTLAELMHQRGGKLPPSEAARVLAPICEALACLHEANVVHRDLKPSNIFVGDDKRVSLMDLGSAHEVGSELTHFGEVLGTEGYLSPEQKLGKRTLDGKSDVYALGCLLLEVLSGKPATSPDAALGVPLPLAELARFAMSLSPADRPSALELKAKLVPYLVTEEQTAPMGKALKLEPPTQHAVFTPTTGSPSYPELAAVRTPEAETREAPKPGGAVTSQTSSTLVLPLTAAVSGVVPNKTAAPRTSGLKPVDVTRPMTALPPRKLNRGAAVLMAVVGLMILGAFGLGLTEPAVQVPPPVRVDKPTVIAPIQKSELKIAQIIEAPRVATVYVPNLDERKSELNTTSGYERRAPRRPNRGPVKIGALRITTTIREFSVPSVIWIKTHPKQKVWQLVGQTPVDLAVVPGDLEIRLQYEEDPYIHIPYQVPPRKDWPKEVGGMRLELEVRNDALQEETVSQGETIAQRVSRSESSSVKPMTKPRPRGGR